MQTGSPAPLPSDYYLANFHSLAGFVQTTYRDVLNDDESQWYASLGASPRHAQQLYIRLLTRKGSVFRRGKLHYPEISSIALACDALAAVDLADSNPPGSLSVLLAAYTKPELLRLLKPCVPSSASRADLIQHIHETESGLQSQYLRILQQAEEWVTVRGHQHWIVFTLCFFGNLYQDSSEFVLRELGSLRYESYPIDPTTRAFSSRAQIDAHLRYFECESLYDTVDSKQEDQLLWLVQQLPQPILGDSHLSRRLDRFRNRVARQLERLDSLENALSLYQESVRPPARERQVRIHLKQGILDKAAVLAEQMAQQPCNDAESSTALRLLKQIDKARGVNAVTPTRFRPETTRLTLQPSNDRVEFAARAFYARFGSCFYTENALVSSVLGLFIWDIIFHPIKGAFFNPFQSAPADFYDPDFSLRRADLLAARYAELESPLRFSTRVMNGYSEHKGKSNPLVRWGRISEALLSQALQCVPVDHWRAMFIRLLQDPRENAAGFPDLVLFREGGDYEFIEIKGPGDTLQHNQRLWMQYFSAHRIPCRVVNIRWAAPSTTSTD